MRVNTMTKYPPVKTTLILNEVTQNQLDELSKSEFTSKSQYLRKVISEQHHKMRNQIDELKNLQIQSVQFFCDEVSISSMSPYMIMF